MAPNTPELPRQSGNYEEGGDNHESDGLLTPSTTADNPPMPESPTWSAPTAPPLTPIARPPNRYFEPQESVDATDGGGGGIGIARSNSTGKKIIRWAGVHGGGSSEESEGDNNGGLNTPTTPTTPHIVVSTEDNKTTEVIHITNETEPLTVITSGQVQHSDQSSPAPPATPNSISSERQYPEKLSLTMTSLDLPDARHPSLDFASFRKTRRNSMNEIYKRMSGSQTNLQPSLLGYNHSHNIRRSSSHNSIEQSLHEWSQEGNDTLIACLSSVYGKLLVVTGMGIPIAQFITHEIPSSFYNSFYLYLYIGSIIFLVYAYIFLLHTISLPDLNLKSKLQKLRSYMALPELNIHKLFQRRNTASHPEGTERMASRDSEHNGDDDDHESDRGSIGTTTFKPPKYTLAENHGSMYLKMGAVLFGIGSMIYSGLEVGQYYEVQGDDSCTDTMLVISPAARMLFTFIQMYFIFLNSRVTISRHRVVARFGMMHLVGTNLCIWLNVLVQETEHEINHLLGHGQHDEEGAADHHDSSSAVLGHHNSTHEIDHSDHSPDSHHLDDMYKMANDSHNMMRRSAGHDVCGGSSTLMRETKDNASPFLFPCTIEYSLLCAGVLYIMWNNINKPMVTYDGDSDITTYVAHKVRHHYSVDCAHANRGLFMGILILVLTIISLILFFVLINNVDYKSVAIVEANIINISLHGVSLVAVVIVTKQMRELEFLPEGDIELDNILLLIAETGVYIFTSFTIIGGLFTMNDQDFMVLPLVSAIITLAQTMLQTIFILDASRRCCYNSDQLERKPGREMVTFLLVCNLAMWAINTFETSRAEAHPAQLNFYGIKAWTIIAHISMPLAIFYRFHVTVCLCEIWKRSYKMKNDY